MHSILATVLFLTYAAISRYFYRADENADTYKVGKRTKITSPKSFKVVYAYLRYSTAVVAVASFFSSHPVLLKVYSGVTPLYIGLAISSLGIILFAMAKLTLGKNYSPCYDSYVPQDIVQEGLYKYLRHPIYTANILFLLGVFVSTGSIWLLMNTILLTVYYAFSAKEEEKALVEEFPAYAQYASKTNQFIPGRKAVLRLVGDETLEPLASEARQEPAHPNQFLD